MQGADRFDKLIDLYMKLDEHDEPTKAKTVHHDPIMSTLHIETLPLPPIRRVKGCNRNKMCQSEYIRGHT